jgi:hypothetical protein
VTDHPTCLACERPITGEPEERTVSRRGPIETVVEWHICACGALARLEHMRQADPLPDPHLRREASGSVTVGFFGSKVGSDESRGAFPPAEPATPPVAPRPARVRRSAQ